MSDKFWGNFGSQDQQLEKQVKLYEVVAIHNPKVITISVNPKEYLEKYRNKESIKKHKGIGKGALGMDFDSFARRILSLNDDETRNKTLIQKIERYLQYVNHKKYVSHKKNSIC